MTGRRDASSEVINGAADVENLLELLGVSARNRVPARNICEARRDARGP